MADVYVVYPVAKKLIPIGSIDLGNDTIKVALLNGYTYNPAHDYWNDVSAHEISPTGTYAAGGTALAGKTIDLDVADEEGYFDATDLIVGTGMTATFQQIVIYKDTGTPATSPLIGCLTLAAATSLTSQAFSINFHADGILRFL